MKLHYSQTYSHVSFFGGELNYHMKLHYSQTELDEELMNGVLNYHMKLHYSQTAYVGNDGAMSLTTI